MGCLMETVNPHIRIIKKVKVKNMKVILIIIVSIAFALVYFILYKLCTLKYKIILSKGLYKSGNEPVYITANCKEIEENTWLPIAGNDAIYTKPCKKLGILTYSKCKDSTATKYIISYPIYKMNTYNDEHFKHRVLTSKNTVEETLSSFINPIKVDNLREYLEYMELFKDIKTYSDIEAYHNTLVEELITKYNAVVESNSQSSYIDNSNETIKRILDICKNSNK